MRPWKDKALTARPRVADTGCLRSSMYRQDWSNLICRKGEGAGVQPKWALLAQALGA